MGWAKFSDDTHANEHILPLSHASFRLWAAAIMDNRGYKDGRSPFISKARAEALCRQQRIPRRSIKDIESAGRWERTEGGWNIRNYSKYLPSRREEASDHEPDPIKVAAGRKSAATRQQTGNSLVATRQQTGNSLVATRQQTGNPVPVPVPVGEQRDKEQSLVVQQHLSASNGGPLAPSPRQRVFGAWQLATGKLRAKLDSKRAALIDRALKAYPEDELMDAVRGWRHSAHHRGENDRATVYNDLDLLLRDAKHIEQFRDLERNGSSGRVVAKSQSQQLGDSFRERAAALREQGS